MTFPANRFRLSLGAARVSGRLREMGIEVKAMGKPLGVLIQSDWKVLTF